jgi:hypothetical protein
LIAQFVGLPFDAVNDGILRSVSRSVERMLARLLTRRVVMAGSPYAVTDPSMHASIVDELVAYNPTAGAVFGVELIRMGHLTIGADDGNAPEVALPARNLDWSGSHPRARSNGDTLRPPLGAAVAAAPPTPQLPREMPDIPLLETVRGRPSSVPEAPPVPRRTSTPPDDALAATSGEINVRPKTTDAVSETNRGLGVVGPSEANRGVVSGSVPAPRRAQPIEIPHPEEITQPTVSTSAGAARTATAVPGAMRIGAPVSEESRGAIMGIGMSHMGSGSVAGEIPTKVPAGSRVLVPGPNGLMQSATVRQLLSGYYELEVGSSGETIWVPIGGVVPE